MSKENGSGVRREQIRMWRHLNSHMGTHKLPPIPIWHQPQLAASKARTCPCGAVKRFLGELVAGRGQEAMVTVSIIFAFNRRFGFVIYEYNIVKNRALCLFLEEEVRLTITLGDTAHVSVIDKLQGILDAHSKEFISNLWD